MISQKEIITPIVGFSDIFTGFIELWCVAIFGRTNWCVSRAANSMNSDPAAENGVGPGSALRKVPHLGRQTQSISRSSQNSIATSGGRFRVESSRSGVLTPPPEADPATRFHEENVS